ncbi:unnamed protein product [Penicillium pancosmium]
MKVLLSGIGHLSKETITWLNEPDFDGPWVSMVKFLTELSRITAAVRATDISDQNAYKRLLNDCYALEKHHMDFYSQIQRNIHGEPPTYSRDELKTGIRSTDDLFGPAYRFSSLEDAMLHLFFWDPCYGWYA